MSVMKKAAPPLLSSDKMLGIAGSGLAAASIGFGLYMNTHGPAPGSLGTSHDFSVFAQLAPHAQIARAARSHAATPATTQDTLDTEATASIPRVAAAEPASAPPADGTGIAVDETSVIPSVTLEAATGDRATIAIDGRMRTVRIGDHVPGAGEVLQIETSPRPVVKTSRGLIVAARPE